MVPLWFTLSALCFVGAAVLLYVDIDRRRGLGRRRKSWAKSHGFDYEHESADILSRWKRGVMSTVGESVQARNVVLGQIRGEAVFVFDLDDVATVIALHRKVGTNVVVDLRLKDIKEPRESDIWLLGAIGPRPLPTRLVKPRNRFRGTSRLPAVSALYCRPGTITTSPLATSARQSRTTSGTSSQNQEGVPDISIPARSWNSVRTKPGHSACTPTPVPPRPFASPSEKAMTQDFDAE